jgi:hypothetical protein
VPVLFLPSIYGKVDARLFRMFFAKPGANRSGATCGFFLSVRSSGPIIKVTAPNFVIPSAGTCSAPRLPHKGFRSVSSHTESSS